MDKMNFKNIALFLFLLFFLFLSWDSYAQHPRTGVIIPSNIIYVGDTVNIAVNVYLDREKQIGPYVVEIETGDGKFLRSAPKGCKDTKVDIKLGYVPPCSFSLSHKYSAPGSYVLRARNCNVEGVWECSDWVSVSVVIKEKQAPPPGGGEEETTPMDKSKLNPLSYAKFGELFDHIAGFLFYLSIILLVLGIMFGGFLMLNSGSFQNIEKGKKIILLAIGFFAIMLIIKIITSFSSKDITFH